MKPLRKVSFDIGPTYLKFDTAADDVNLAMTESNSIGQVRGGFS